MSQPQTYEEFLIANGQEGLVREPANCPDCKRNKPAFMLDDVSGREEWPDTIRWVCRPCILHHDRQLVATAEALAKSLETGWATTAGDAVRSARNNKLSQTMWTVLEDSPLSAVNKQAWRDYRVALHALAITYDDPADVIWPTPPDLVYGA